MYINLKLLVILPLLVSMEIEAERRIFHGEEVEDIKEIPFVVKIKAYKGERNPITPVKVAHCTGSYIRANWVLTVTHCVEVHLPLKNHKPKYDVLMCMGEIKPEDCPKNHQRFSDGLYPHTDGIPAYKAHDIMLIHIAEPWELGPTIQLAKLPPNEKGKVDLNMYIGKQCLTAGWGRFNPVESSIILKKAKVKVSPYCDNNKFHICVEYITGIACDGDSGGPLVCDDTLTGALEGGTGTCNDTENTSVYNSVLLYKEWIVSVARPDGASSIFPNNFCLPIFFVTSFSFLF